MEEKKAYEQEAESQIKEEAMETADTAEQAADAAGQAGKSSEEAADAAGTEPGSDTAGNGSDCEQDADKTGEEVSDEEDPDGEKSTDEDASGKDAGSQSGKNCFFHKKDKKHKKHEKIEELNDRVRRQMAEFDNFRKRTEKEKSQMFETGAKSIIEKILPVIDNFERGLAALSEEEKGTPFADGMEKIYKQMMTVLDEAGVRVIETEGKEFDPNLHNAVMHIDDESFGENIIAEEFQKGYTYRDSVVRHSMVKVAN
ncbi:MAG: nucleotide exchange factor GrpE [Clostridiales bacterium]|nr:nucleotide exchange factor GrpE [Clostridiales bacterium]